MGNMPYARTTTLVPGDPLASGLVDELEDMAAGDRRTYFKRPYFPVAWASSGAAATLITNPAGAGPPVPVWHIPTAVTVTARLPYEIGDIMAPGSSLTLPPSVAGGVGFQYEVYGDGVTDFTMSILYAPGVAGVSSGLNNLTGGVTLGTRSQTNPPASWGVNTVDVLSLVSLGELGVLYVQFVTSGGGGGGINVGHLQPRYVR